MSRKPIHEETFPFRMAAFDKFPVKAGIDSGSSLTKIAFIPKDSPTHAHTVQLRCLTFHNDHFIDALHVMKEQAQLPDQGQLHVTGIGAATHKHQIKEIIGLDVVFINEMITLGYGPFVFISNTNPEDIFYPVPDYRKWEGVDFKSFRSNKSAMTTGSGDELFPALVCYMGSGCGVMAVGKDGTASVETDSCISGKPFMGLAHALLGTADYDEIMDLAEKGNATVADATMGDLVKADPDSPYGRFPPDQPAFPFGNAANKSWDRSRCSREDLAASLLEMTLLGLALMLLPIVQNTGFTRIYFTGNFFRREIARKVLHEKMAIYLQSMGVQVLLLKSGHQGAVGAMLADADPEEQRKMMK